MSERPDIPEFITNSKYFYSDSDYFNIIDYKASPTKKALKSTYFFKLYKRLKDKVRFAKWEPRANIPSWFKENKNE